MGGRMSRNKGARGEREVIGMLQPIIDRVCDTCGQPKLVLRRNADQRYAKKQYDLIGVPWIAVEVKRHENLSGINGWWRQIVEATLEHQTPVLFYRKNHAPWRVRMYVPMVAGPKRRVKGVVDVDIGTFLIWFEQRLLSELSN